MTARQPPPPANVVGWREWVNLPELGISAVKAKVDTGARSSCLHAFDVHVVQQDGIQVVRFKVHPLQRNSAATVAVEAPLLEYRRVRSSSGHQTRRPVILTAVELLGQRWNIELTLASRDAMGFRMLLGREALRPRFCIDPAKSFLGGIPIEHQRARKAKKGTKQAKNRKGRPKS